MDFIPVTYTKEQKRRDRRVMSGFIGGGAVGIAQLPALLGTGALSVSTGGGLPFLLSVGVTMFGLVSIMPFSLILQDDWAATRAKARSEQIRSALNGHYGLSLTEGQFESLGYPMDHPGPGFQTFGSIKIQDQVEGGNFLERTLYLNSTDGDLVLSESRDGKRFKELKPARPALEAPKISSREVLEAPAATESLSSAPSVAQGVSA